MKPHPRIRKTIKWGGAAVTVLLVVVWGWSGWYAINWDFQDGTWASARAGRFHYQYRSYREQQSREYVYFHGGAFEWVPYLDDPGGRCGLPLWLLIAPLTVISVVCWRLDILARRRARLNLCPKCNYDRTGLATDAKCPECGAVPASV